MELTTTSMDLKDNQASINNIELNEIVVRGGQLSHKSVKHVVSVILISTVFILFFFFRSPPPLHGGYFTLYSSPRTILIQHLLVI